MLLSLEQNKILSLTRNHRALFTVPSNNLLHAISVFTPCDDKRVLLSRWSISMLATIQTRRYRHNAFARSRSAPQTDQATHVILKEKRQRALGIPGIETTGPTAVGAGHEVDLVPNVLCYPHTNLPEIERRYRRRACRL